MPTLRSVGGSSGKSPLRSNREHYLRLRKSQFLGSRNLYDFCHQPYAVWLRHGPLLKTILRLQSPPKGGGPPGREPQAEANAGGSRVKAPLRSGRILLRLSRPNIEPGAADEIHCLCDLILSLRGERWNVRGVWLSALLPDDRASMRRHQFQANARKIQVAALARPQLPFATCFH